MSYNIAVEDLHNAVLESIWRANMRGTSLTQTIPLP